MPIPGDVILQKPLVLIVQAGSPIGGGSVGTGILFGTVEKIYSSSDKYAEGDSVVYNSVGQQLVNYTGTEYALIDEKNILYKEIAPP